MLTTRFSTTSRNAQTFLANAEVKAAHWRSTLLVSLWTMGAWLLATTITLMMVKGRVPLTIFCHLGDSGNGDLRQYYY